MIQTSDSAARPLGDSVGARLRSLRLSRRLTQRQLADRARISLEAVWTIENGRKHPRRSTASLLAEALGVDPAALGRPSPAGLPSQPRAGGF